MVRIVAEAHEKERPSHFLLLRDPGCAVGPCRPVQLSSVIEDYAAASGSGRVVVLVVDENIVRANLVLIADKQNGVIGRLSEAQEESEDLRVIAHNCAFLQESNHVQAAIRMSAGQRAKPEIGRGA